MLRLAILNSLQGRLTIVLATAATLAAISITYVIFEVEKHEREEIIEGVQQDAWRVAKLQEERIAAARSILIGAGVWTPLPDEFIGGFSESDRSACESAAETFRIADPSITSFGVYEQNGVAICESGVSASPEVMRRNEAFALALQTGRFVFGGYQSKPLTFNGPGAIRPPLSMAMPVERHGQTVVVHAGLRWEWLERSLARAFMTDGSTVAVLSSGGKLLGAYPPHAQEFVAAAIAGLQPAQDGAPKVAINATTASGAQAILGSAPVMLDGEHLATILTVINETEALAIERDRSMHLLAALGTGWLATILVTWLALSRTSMSIRVVADAARRMREGDLNARCPVEGENETREVCNALNDLADSLVVRLAERDKAESEARASAELFQQISENVQEVFWVVDFNPDRIAYLSPSIEGLWALEPQSFKTPADFLSVLLPEDRPAFLKAMAGARERGWTADLEFRIRDGLDRVRWARVRVYPVVDATSEIVRLVGFADDVTPQKNESLLREAALKEKEALLKEIHHRVKNNLQVVSSLLNLQARRCKGASASALADSRDRVRSMALIHELLYRSQNPSQVDFSAYARRIVDMNLSAMGPIAERVKVEWRIDPEIWLEIMQAVPLGLILNELVSNCFKHAFKTAKSGQALIELVHDAEADNPNELILRVADDGPGLPETFAAVGGETLGMELVQALVGQIGGKLEFGPWEEIGRGASFTVRFTRI